MHTKKSQIFLLKSVLTFFCDLPVVPNQCFGDPSAYVTSFSSISYYSNVRLISKMHLEQNHRYNEHLYHAFMYSLVSYILSEILPAIQSKLPSNLS